MYIKKIIIGGIILIVSAIAIKAFASRNMTAEQKSEKVTTKMAKKLNLDDTQKEQVYQINLARAEGMKKAYEAGRKKEIAKEAVNKWKTDMKEVLNESQAKKLRLK